VTRFTADSRDRVRDAADMLAVVSDYTELRRAGASEYEGLCPFHDERTPSFGVNPDEKLYHCFGCQASGDVFKFVMETQGLDFNGALQALADRFGVTLETETEAPAAAAQRARRERLQALLGRAASYYARCLWDSGEAAPARAYLLGRGFSEEILREFRVGYAPRAWERMVAASRQSGFSDEDLLGAGLIRRSRTQPGETFAYFRERIMFPACDGRGRVVGFGARATREGQRAKYLNTADNDLYHKREILFGIDLARAAAARSRRMILVEGYTDVLALHQAGLRNAVGIMGTSLTEEQVGELQRVAHVLELCLDADRAGQDAMLRASKLAAGRKLELRVVQLPEGADPAELIEREGAEALRARVQAAVPFADFHVSRILPRDARASAEERDRALRELRRVFADLPPGVLRDELTRRAAGRLGLSERLAASLLEQAPTPTAQVAPAAAAPPMRDPAVRNEREFLILCLAQPEAGRRALAAIDPDEHFTSESLRRAARRLADQPELPLSGLVADDEQLESVLADLERGAVEQQDVRPEALEHQRLLLERARLQRAIRRARSEERGKLPELARQSEAVLEAIHTIGGRLEKAV